MRSKLVLVVSAALLFAGCCPPVKWAYDRSRDPSAWSRSTCRSLRASVMVPGANEAVLLARVEGEAELVGCVAGDRIAQLTVLEDDARDAVVREASREIHLEADAFALVLDASPGVPIPGRTLPVTAFACAELGSEPVVLARGPSGWRRCEVLEYERWGRGAPGLLRPR